MEFGKTLNKTALNLCNGDKKKARARLEEIYLESGGGELTDLLIRKMHARLVSRTGAGKQHVSAHIVRHENLPRADFAKGRHRKKSKGVRINSIIGQTTHH